MRSRTIGIFAVFDVIEKNKKIIQIFKHMVQAGQITMPQRRT